MVKDRVGRFAGVEREVFQAPDGTKYTDRAEVDERIKNQSGPAISALSALSGQFAICKKILAEQTKKQQDGKEGSSSSSSSSSSSLDKIEDIDMHMDCLNHPDILRKNMKDGQASKWLNHLDDILIIEQFHSEAETLLEELKKEDPVEVAKKGEEACKAAKIKYAGGTQENSVDENDVDAPKTLRGILETISIKSFPTTIFSSSGNRDKNTEESESSSSVTSSSSSSNDTALATALSLSLAEQEDEKKGGDGDGDGDKDAKEEESAKEKKEKPLWSMIDDINLLMGVFKYGTFEKTYRPDTYDDLLKDETMSFHQVRFSFLFLLLLFSFAYFIFYNLLLK
jgi:hypothetical protein